MKYYFLMLLVLFSFFFIFLPSLNDRENLNDEPVSYWINDSNTCVSGTAQAIVDSGLPYPHFHYETIIDPKTGKEKQRLKAIDMWLGTGRYVIPGEYAYWRGGYTKTHPYRHMGLRGSLPDFYPSKLQADTENHKRSKVSVTFKCSIETTIGWQSSQEGMTSFTAKVQKDTDRRNEHFKNNSATVTTRIIEDINMVEIRYTPNVTATIEERASSMAEYGWAATYWPLENEIVSFDGRVSGIHCETRRYHAERTGWPCQVSVSINDNFYAIISVTTVDDIFELHNIYSQLKQLLIDSKQLPAK